MTRWAFLLAALGNAVSAAAESGASSAGVSLEPAIAALRAADISSATDFFQQALSADPRRAAAHLGLARAYRMSFDRARSLQHYAAAFEVAPRSVVVVKEYAAATPDRELESALLNRLLRLGEAPVEWKRLAAERLEFHARLAGRMVNRLVSPYESHQIRTPVAHTPEGRPVGWMIQASINGAKPLRLLLDTGSRGILVSSGVASRLTLEPLGRASLGGFGDGNEVKGHYALARTVRIHKLEWADVVVEVSTERPPMDLDGLIGLDAFRHFEITLDGKRRMLELKPFDADPSEGAGERPWHHAHPAAGASLLQSGHLLLVRGEGPRGEPVRFVLDSGASYSLVQQREPAVALRQVALEGLSGSLTAPELLRPIRVRLAGYDGPLREALVTDLTPIGEAYGVEIDGFAGFPLVRNLVTRIDLRSGRISLRDTRP